MSKKMITSISHVDEPLSPAAASQRGVAVALILLALLLAGCNRSEPEPAPSKNSRVEVVMPKDGAYLGAYVDFGFGEGNVTREAVTAFEQMTGKHLAVIAFGNF